MGRRRNSSESLIGLAFIEINSYQHSLSGSGEQEFQTFEREPRPAQAQIPVSVLEVHVHSCAEAVIRRCPVIQLEDASRTISSVDVAFDWIGNQGLRGKGGNSSGSIFKLDEDRKSTRLNSSH